MGVEEAIADRFSNVLDTYFFFYPSTYNLAGRHLKVRLLLLSSVTNTDLTPSTMHFNILNSFSLPIFLMML